MKPDAERPDSGAEGSATPSTPTPAPAAPEVAASIFGDRLELASAYVALLADTGVTHGLIGPREVPRLWERHVLNCAVLTDLLPQGTSVIDIGSGAGLPGLALVVRRPDLTVTLVEPLLRRTTWLSEVVRDLGLQDQVVVHRGRAEEVAGLVSAPFVTARAVAPLDRLATWGLPLLEPSGSLLALKGRSAAAELEAAETLLARARCQASIVQVGTDLLAEPTTVVRLDRDSGELPNLSAGPAKRKRTSRARRRS